MVLLIPVLIVPRYVEAWRAVGVTIQHVLVCRARYYATLVELEDVQRHYGLVAEALGRAGGILMSWTKVRSKLGLTMVKLSEDGHLVDAEGRKEGP